MTTQGSGKGRPPVIGVDADKREGTYRQIGTITAPSASVPPALGEWCFDISWYSEEDHLFYLADDTNAHVSIFDLSATACAGSINGNFSGAQGCSRGKYDSLGPNGVLTDNHHQAWTGNGNSTAIVTATIPTGGTRRADELSYDRDDGIILIANPSETLSGKVNFITFISDEDHKVLGKIEFPNAIGGLEQSQYDARTRKFYLVIPSTTQHPGGEVVVIDPRERAVEHVFPVSNCAPNGLALGPNGDMLLGCSAGSDGVVIMDSRTGQVDTRISQVNGCDEVWYNPGDHHYYAAASGDPRGPLLGIIDAERRTWIQNISTGDLGAHSVAVDSRNNHILVPTSAGIKVYARKGDG